MKDNGRVVRVLADRWSNHRLYIHNGENKRELNRIAPNCVTRGMRNGAHTESYDCI